MPGKENNSHLPPHIVTRDLEKKADKCIDMDNGPFRLILSPGYRSAFFVLLCIVLGNISYYMLRIHWQMAATPLKQQEIIDNQGYGEILSFCYIVNIIGKPLGGLITDYTGRPKMSFVFFICLTVSATLAATQLPYLDTIKVFWSLSRLFTTMGRMSVIKIMATCWPGNVMGTVMGIITVSCSVGEAFSKVFLSQLLRVLDWKQMFYVACGVTGFLILPSVLYVSDRRINNGFKDEEEITIENEKMPSPKAATPKSPAGSVPTTPAPRSSKTFFQNMAFVFAKPRFLFLLLLSTQITAIREILGHWSIMFLGDVLELPSHMVGSIHAIFSACSAISAMFGGRTMDSVARRHRGIIFSVYIFGIGLFQIILYFLIINRESMGMGLDKFAPAAVALIACAEFMMGPPSSFIDGLFVIDLVDKERVSFASGAVGCIGYFGPLIANQFIQVWGQEKRFDIIWLFGALASFVCFALSLVYWYLDYTKVEAERKAMGDSVRN